MIVLDEPDIKNIYGDILIYHRVWNGSLMYTNKEPIFYKKKIKNQLLQLLIF